MLWRGCDALSFFALRTSTAESRSLSFISWQKKCELKKKINIKGFFWHNFYSKLTELNATYYAHLDFGQSL